MNRKNRAAALRLVWAVGLLVGASAAFRLLGSGDTVWGVALLVGVVLVFMAGVVVEVRSA